MFTLDFWKTTAENMAVSGITAFTGSLVITTTPTLKDLAAAGVAAGVAALYSLNKQIGGIQHAAGTLKVKIGK